jgi:hypothetical protein
MSLTDWASPVLSFGGAVLGAFLVYRVGQDQESGRRFEAAMDLLASDQARQRALGRARVVEICRQGSIDSRGRQQALQVLGADVTTSCPEPVRQRLSTTTSPTTTVNVVIADVDEARVEGRHIFVPRSLVESAVAYVEVAGGGDAAPEQLIALIAQADEATPDQDTTAEVPSSGRPLPVHERLILIKLSPDATALDQAELRERTRRAWRLSLTRLQEDRPAAVAAVVQQQVIGAWEYLDAAPDSQLPERVEFTLGADRPDLVGCEYLERGQNPIRYWP